MRVSIWIGLLTLGLGIFFSYLARAMADTITTSALQTTATIFATILFILFSASLVGIGAALVTHWLLGFFGHWPSFMAEIILSFGVFFMGIGATIMSKHWTIAIHVFFSFFTASIVLFALSFVSFFGGVFQGFRKITKYVKKKIKR